MQNIFREIVSLGDLERGRFNLLEGNTVMLRDVKHSSKCCLGFVNVNCVGSDPLTRHVAIATASGSTQSKTLNQYSFIRMFL